jgi:hypothetical protein
MLLRLGNAYGRADHACAAEGVKQTANIKVTRDGKVKVLDFDLAKAYIPARWRSTGFMFQVLAPFN